jgi:hypothetical protein
VAQNGSAPSHRIYLLTMWEERRGDAEVPVQWRFSLEHPASGQRRGFASLAALVATLQQMTSGEEDWARKEESNSS